jgi:phosphatidate cytidylyltransferase
MTEALLVNPLDDPLFLATLYRWAILLLMGFVGVVFASRRRSTRLRDDVLFVRWRTWAFIAPIYLLSVLGGLLPTAALVIWLTFQGLTEYSRLVGLSPAYRRILVAMGLAVPPIASISLDGFYLMAPLLLIIATLQPLVLGNEPGGVRQLAFASFGWGYLAWFMGHMLLIRQHVAGGAGLLLVLGLAVALSDVGAFTFGKAFGQHKLSPRLSPNKTVEGVAGNFLGAYVGVAVMHYALPESLKIIAFAGLPILIGIGSLWGDLVESAFKREFGVKDAGTWLPGFGGLLDRIDSLLIVLPLSYYLFRMLG